MNNLELTKYFKGKDKFQKTNIIMDGLREFHAHPDGGTTLIFERASSAHSVGQVHETARSENNDRLSRARACAAGALLKRQDQSWRDLPAIEEIRVQETPGQIAKMVEHLRR